MYDNINILLATKHSKEQAISEPFAKYLHAKIEVPTDYDTDKFGTFSGEIKRTGTPLETALNKAQDAMHHYHYDYAIASEGSFGPHPLYFFMPADIEIMVFIDRKRNLSIIESEISTETNFGHHDIMIDDDYTEFLSRVKFGTHGLIIKCTEDDDVIAKGITQSDQLNNILKKSFMAHKKIRLETDMRAMMNPMRMQVIHTLANKLAMRIKNICPKCNIPGFGKLTFEGKLPCKNCCTDTEIYQYKVLNCIQCDYTETKPRDDGLSKADPKYCPYCNP